MATKATLSATDIDTTAPAPTDVTVDNGTKDASGNTWRTEKEGRQVRVYLVTKDNLDLNVLVDDEAEGRRLLTDFIK